MICTLDQTVMFPNTPMIGLCTIEKEYHEYRKLFGGSIDEWIGSTAVASTNMWFDFDGKRKIAVCIDLVKSLDRPAIQTAAILVHEAVHVSQMYFESFGERNPAVEQQAYTIELFSRFLMERYAAALTKHLKKQRKSKAYHLTRRTN